ncbi:hypothetical protein GCM10009577_37240 [Streptomyces javensis]
MEWWQAAQWGAVGAALGELTDFVRVLKDKGNLPWKLQNGPACGIYLLMVLCRTALGFGVAAALGSWGDISGGLGAGVAGIGAPKIIDSLRSQAVAPTEVPMPVPVGETER